jgi:hypothetical protein
MMTNIQLLRRPEPLVGVQNRLGVQKINHPDQRRQYRTQIQTEKKIFIGKYMKRLAMKPGRATRSGATRLRAGIGPPTRA